MRRRHAKNPKLQFLPFSLLIFIASHKRGVCGLGLGKEFDEYDFTILDPDSPHGSPYGGFSRATASRLAALPLKLPHVADKLEEFEPFFFQVRDAMGRPYSCRAYHEDELDKGTLEEGMFEPPALKVIPAEDIVEDDETREEDSSAVLDEEATRVDPAEELETRLGALHGMCAQYHQGWWSYEWCYKGKMTQFHIDVKDMGKRFQYLGVTDVTSLGQFHERKAVISKDVNHKMHNKEGVAEAIEVYTGGDICKETGLPRETTVVMTCCPASTSKKGSKGTVIFDGKPYETDLLWIQGVVESKHKICTYTVTICTPLLCEEERQTVDPLPITKSSSPSPRTSSKEELENMSVSEILDLSFGVGTRTRCIQFGTGGWWVYELCPGRLIRQYHEVTLLDRVSGLTSTAIETEHILGRFDLASRLPKDREWEHVVNATALHTSSSSKSKNNAARTRTALVVHGGNGAYLYQEYIGGDVCDHEDVTDSAIKAGEVGEGLIERSTTVKYGCGNQLDMSVKEDSTCHYVAYVSLPELCHHPLFRPPLSKKQVVKCMPDFEE